jgi:hypothetical protein
VDLFLTALLVAIFGSVIAVLLRLLRFGEMP